MRNTVTEIDEGIERSTREKAMNNPDIVNTFELVVLAAKRATEIVEGATPSIPREGRGHCVLALKEIADQTINVNQLRDRVISAHQDNSDNNIDIITDITPGAYVYEEDREGFDINTIE